MTDPAKPDPTAGALLTRKRRARSGHRGTATRLVKSLHSWRRMCSTCIDQLSLSKQMLLEKIETLKVLNEKMAGLVPDEELEDEIQTVDQYRERI